MFEMLGNQLFMVRNYSRATEMLEKALWRKPENKAVRRRLIICYTQIGAVDKALDTFISLIEEDIEYVINTVPTDDDCPCTELVFDMEDKLNQNVNSIDFHLILGMLWLYCDISNSKYYFNQAQKLDPENPKIKRIIKFINSHLKAAKTGSKATDRIGKE